MKRLLNKVEKTRTEYECACEKLEQKIREVCEFNARLTCCAGDGHLVLNEETSSVAGLGCLSGRSKQNKLTEKEHLEWSI